MGSVLHKSFTVDTTSGAVSISGLAPANDLTFPAGATHVSFSAAFAKVDFTTKQSEIKISNVTDLPIDATVTDVTLTPVALPILATGIKFFLLKVEFFQTVNGLEYSLNNGQYNTLSIVNVE